MRRPTPDAVWALGTSVIYDWLDTDPYVPEVIQDDQDDQDDDGPTEYDPMFTGHLGRGMRPTNLEPEIAAPSIEALDHRGIPVCRQHVCGRRIHPKPRCE